MPTWKFSKRRYFWASLLALLATVVASFVVIYISLFDSPFLDRLKLHAQLRAGDYQSLERRLTALHESYLKGELPEKFVNHAFRGFANSSADLETNLGHWIRNFPDSYAAHTARGMYFQNLAWLARQGRLARDTAPEQFQRMDIYFDKARANFEAALAIRPNLGIAYSRLYVIAVANGSRKDRKEILRRGFGATPDSHALLLAWMWSLRPEWGGSLADMVRFGRFLDKKRATNPKIAWLKSHIYLVRAKRYSRASDYDEAIRILTEGLEQKEMSDLYIC